MTSTNWIYPPQLQQADLTKKETDVAALIAIGFSNKEITSKLNIGVRTVETHRERLMVKIKKATGWKSVNPAKIANYAHTFGLIVFCAKKGDYVAKDEWTAEPATVQSDTTAMLSTLSCVNTTIIP